MIRISGWEFITGNDAGEMFMVKERFPTQQVEVIDLQTNQSVVVPFDLINIAAFYIKENEK